MIDPTIYRMKNGANSSRIVVIEPWAEQIALEVGSAIEVSVEAGKPRSGASHFELLDDSIIFWCEASQCSVSIDGKEVF